MKTPRKTRSFRLGNEIQKVIGEYLRREVEANLPGCMITVTEVRVSDDYRHAAIYVSIHAGERSDGDIQRAIVRSLPRIRKTVAQMVRMKKLPEFRFVWDDTVESADRIEQLLNKIHSSSSPPNEDESGDN